MEITKEKIISEEKKKETIYNLFDINTKDVVICAKRDLLLKKFGVFFKDVYFNNKNFIKMRRLFDYLYTINGTENESIYEPNFKVSFPTTMKNFSSCKLFYPKLFFKQNLNQSHYTLKFYFKMPILSSAPPSLNTDIDKLGVVTYN